MDFAHDARTVELQQELLAFMDSHVYPAEVVWHEQVRGAAGSWSPAPVLSSLTTEARSRGLWNLFLTGERGAGLSNLQYAPLAEISGRSIHLAPPAMNCAAPDTATWSCSASSARRSRRSSGSSRCSTGASARRSR